ncbi:S41 family peptidase [uncultured Alistipes sp.]|uniref:S41 family peptidase n=1 Tax=uncultured Alistipes sp. TaxID=538949 RepID=UPI0025EF8D61|nr:S41 family peptidase [uncultured Alistipes sp.]
MDFVYENLKRTASYQTQKERHAAVESKYEELKQKGPDYDPCTVESYIKLYELVDQLVDNHNAVRGNTKTFAYKDLSDEAFLRKIKSDPAYNFYPRAKMDLDSLETALSTRKTEDYEGIYYREPYFKIAIFKKEEGLLQGVILDTKIPSWERGETMLWLTDKGNDRFRLYIGGLVDKKLVSIRDYFKDGAFKMFRWEKEPSKKSFYNANHPGEDYVFEKINGSFTYIKLGTFSASPAGVKKAKEFYDSIAGKPDTGNLIVDIRNNGGGGDRNSKMFYDMFRKFKGKIYLLTNYYTASNAEQFTVKMKALNHVTLVGDRTSGGITYGRNYPDDLETPSRRFRIYFSDLKDNWKEFLPYENTGVEPAVYLDSGSDWVEAVVDRFGN